MRFYPINRPSYKERTFNICMAYLKFPCAKTKRNLKKCLIKWSQSTLDLSDYGYSKFDDNGEDITYLHISYCSDRMNKGRALALLRILE